MPFRLKKKMTTKRTNVTSCGGGAVVGSAGRDAPVGWLALATRLESATAGPSRGSALVTNGLRCTPRNELTVFPAQQVLQFVLLRLLVRTYFSFTLTLFLLSYRRYLSARL